MQLLALWEWSKWSLPHCQMFGCISDAHRCQLWPYFAPLLRVKLSSAQKILTVGRRGDKLWGNDKLTDSVRLFVWAGVRIEPCKNPYRTTDQSVRRHFLQLQWQATPSCLNRVNTNWIVEILNQKSKLWNWKPTFILEWRLYYSN